MQVRAVYEALEMRKNKQALKLLVPLLEKKPGNSQLRILKALALIRLGRKEEALKLSRELKGVPDVAENVSLLNNLAIVFRESGAPSEATECFVSALNRQPDNEELAQCVFQSYGRERNFLKQQQLAQKLHKQFGNPQYILWSIVATTLQVLEGAPPKLLVLAERQMAKRTEEGNLATYEELQLYLEILERQGKHAEALEVIKGQAGPLYTSTVERKQREATLLCALERWDDARAAYQALLELNEGQVKGREEWSHVRGVIHCAMQAKGISPAGNAPLGGSIGGSGGAEVVGKQDGVPDADWAWVAEQGDALVTWLYGKQKEEGAPPTRTPLLAEVELHTQLAQLRGEDAGGRTVARALDAVRRYFEAWGGKDACAYDLAAPLRRLPRETWAPLAASLEPLAADAQGAAADGGSPEFEKACLRAANLAKLQRMLGSAVGAPQARVLAEVRAHIGAVGACKARLRRQKGFPPDRTPADDNCLMAARLLLDQYISDGDEKWLVEAALVGRYGLQVSPTNFQFKLLLLRVLRLLGDWESYSDLFTQLDVKHILWDTLSYLVLPAAWGWAAASKAKHVCECLARLERDGRKDTPEYAYQAFKFGTYSKVSELMRFENRLTCSLQLASSRGDMAALLLLENLASLGDARAFLQSMGGLPTLYLSDEAASRLIDNRDLTVEVTCDPLDAPAAAARERAPARAAELRLQAQIAAAGPHVLAATLGVKAPPEVPARAALVAQLQGLLERAGWVSGAPAAQVAVLPPGPSPLEPAGARGRVYADGVQPDSLLCRLAWAACLLLAQLGEEADAAVAGAAAAADAAPAGGGDAHSAALAARLAELFGEMLRELGRVWKIAGGREGGGGELTVGALSGVDVSEGVGGLMAWAVRPLVWIGLCVPAWGASIAGCGKPATPAGQARLANAKAAVADVRKSAAEAMATAIKMVKAVEAAHKAVGGGVAAAAAVGALLPELETNMEGLGHERARLAKSVAGSKEQALKAVRAMLQARQDALAAASAR